MDHPQIWGSFFKNPDDWKPWRTFLKVIFRLPLDDDDLALYRECSGRTEPPDEIEEVWAIIGRRGGKSRIFALIAAFLAIFRDWSEYLDPGETGYIKIIAVDKKQARLVRRYCVAFLRACPTLAKFIQSDDDDTIELNNGIAIEVQTASQRSSRGYTAIALIADEIGHWPTDEESKNQDAEVLAAIRPGMATVPNALLLAGSSPYAKKGELYANFRDHYGKEGDPILVWKAPTRVMHPSVRQSFIDRMIERDPAKNTAEYMAEFRNDIQSFVSREIVDAAVVLGRFELPPRRGTAYFAFVDPAGGSGSDSMTLAIAHKTPEGVVALDAIRERRPPFSPSSAVSEFSNTVKSYGIRKVTGDAYAGEWPREAFSKNGITYETADRPKSQLYTDALPLLNSGQLELLDNERLINQLCGLERRVARSGRESIDHAPGAHDDVSNAVCGVFCTAADSRSQPVRITQAMVRRARTHPYARNRLDNPDHDTGQRRRRPGRFSRFARIKALPMS